MLREICEEVKSGDAEEYQKYFKSVLKKYGVESPAELPDEEKKKFFDEVDKGWKAKNEESKEILRRKYGDYFVGWDGKIVTLYDKTGNKIGDMPGKSLSSTRVKILMDKYGVSL